MDDLPYEFADRVFTKFDSYHLSAVDFQSPIWKEAGRVHSEKLECYDVTLRFAGKNDDGLSYEICRFTEGLEEISITLDEALKLDSRFKRVATFSVQKIDPDELLTDLPANRLHELLEYVSSFNLTRLELQELEDASAQFQHTIAETEFRTRELHIDHFLEGGEEFLRKQLRAPDLEKVFAYCFCGDDLQDDAEAFVCRPNFVDLDCNFDCFDIENFKQIITYWREVKPNRECWIRTEPGRNMHKDFVTWMTPPDGEQDTSCIREKIGNFMLTIKCNHFACKLNVEAISKRC